MDEQRFDQLARSLARDNSRRGLIKGLVGVIGSALGLGAATAAEARTRGVNGSACDSSRDCASAMCVDDVCCDGPCTGVCEACNSAGVCAPVTGAPVGERGACPGDGGVCGGACDGVTTATCAGYAGNETACGEASCQGDYLIDHVCSGNGLCVEVPSYCGPAGCAPDGRSCQTGCKTDTDCPASAYCVSGVCQGDFLLGAPCERAEQCQLGHCVDGVCCDSGCDGPCQACGTDGFCGDGPDSEECNGGICCNGACTALGADENCAACGDVCDGDETCCADGCQTLGDNANCGYCGDQCDAGSTCCSGVCTPLNTDANCGFCGDHCGIGQICCDGYCTTLGTDDDCAFCGNVCDNRDTCISGVCTEICLTLGEPCGEGNCCVDGTICAEYDQELDLGCCLAFGASGCTGTGTGGCCYRDSGDVWHEIHFGEGVCGGPGASCSVDTQCGLGVCCGAHESEGVCTELGTLENCNDCGDVCVNGEICSSGGCVCPEELGTNQNCGACGDARDDHETCTSGVCLCDSGYTLCHDACIDDALCCADSDCSPRGVCYAPAVCDDAGICQAPPLAPETTCQTSKECDGVGTCRTLCTSMTIVAESYNGQVGTTRRSAIFQVTGPDPSGLSPVLHIFRNGVFVKDRPGVTDFGDWFFQAYYDIFCWQSDEVLYSITDVTTGCVAFTTHDLGC